MGSLWIPHSNSCTSETQESQPEPSPNPVGSQCLPQPNVNYSHNPQTTTPGQSLSDPSLAVLCSLVILRCVHSWGKDPLSSIQHLSNSRSPGPYHLVLRGTS